MDTDPIDTKPSGLKQLLDHHYFFLFASFVLFIDFASTILLSRPLALMRITEQQNSVTVGATLILVLIFSLFCLLVPLVRRLFHAVLSRILRPLVSWWWSRDSAVRFRHEYDYGIENYYAKAYAIANGHKVIWDMCMAYEKNILRHMQVSNALFGLSLQLVVGAMWIKGDSMDIIASESSQLLVGMALLTFSLDLFTYPNLSIYGMGHSTVKEIKSWSVKNYFSPDHSQKLTKAGKE